MAGVPRGIQVREWKNKDGSISHSYQVRIVRKDLKKTATFDNLSEAMQFLALSKSAAGRDKIRADEYYIQPAEVVDKKASKIDSYRKLKELLNEYYLTFIYEPPLTEIKDKKNKTYMALISSICNQPMLSEQPFNPENYKICRNAPLFGDYDIFKIKEMDIVRFINSKLSCPNQLDLKEYRALPLEEQTQKKWNSLAPVSQSTIIRQVGFLQSFFNRLPTMSRQEIWNTIKQPVTKNAKARLNVPYEKRDRRFSEEEQKILWDVLDAYSNPEVGQIVKLALYTGCRRNEIISLKWSQIHENYIQLYSGNTKTRKSRKVRLEPEAMEVLNTIKRVEGRDRLFKYTAEGFKTVLDGLMDDAGISDLQFRDLRSEYISRKLDTGLESIVVAEMANIKHQAYFESTHVKNHQEGLLVNGLQNGQDAVQKTVGHATKSMTRHYYRSK